MSGPQRISAEAFATEQLRGEPGLDFTTLRDRARAEGLSLQPIHYGRARKQLGLPALRDSRPPQTSRVAEKTTQRPAAVPAAAAPAADADDTPAPAPRRQGSAAFDFLLQQLRENGTLSYGELRARAEAKGHGIAPIMYGRAKAVLGLVPVKPRSTKAATAKAKAAAAAPALPLQLRQVESVAADRFAKKLEDVRSLDQLVAIVRDLDAERRRLRDVLERVITMLDEALG